MYLFNLYSLTLPLSPSQLSFLKLFPQFLPLIVLHSSQSNNDDSVTSAGAYLEKEGGGCLVAREAAAILATPLLPRKKVTFTAISHDNDNNAHMCIGVVIIIKQINYK